MKRKKWRIQQRPSLFCQTILTCRMAYYLALNSILPSISQHSYQPPYISRTNVCKTWKMIIFTTLLRDVSPILVIISTGFYTHYFPAVRSIREYLDIFLHIWPLHDCGQWSSRITRYHLAPCHPCQFILINHVFLTTHISIHSLCLHSFICTVSSQVSIPDLHPRVWQVWQCIFQTSTPRVWKIWKIHCLTCKNV